MSRVTLTPVTVTKPTRGSFNRWISSAMISRNSSPTRSVRDPCGTSALRIVEREIGVDHLDFARAFDQPSHLVHDLLDVVPLRAGHRHGDRRPLPEVVMIHLGHAHVELLSQCVRESLHDVPLLLQRAASGNPKVEPLESNQHQIERATSCTSKASMTSPSLTSW